MNLRRFEAVLLIASLLSSFVTISPARADGDLVNSASQLALLRAEERSVRELLTEVRGQLLSLSEGFAPTMPATTQPTIEQQRQALYDRTVLLNNRKIRYQKRLKELSQEIRENELTAMFRAFPGTVDLYLAEARSDDGSPLIRNVTCEGPIEMNGRTLIRFVASDGTIWTVDPSKIVAAQCTPSTQPSR